VKIILSPSKTQNWQQTNPLNGQQPLGWEKAKWLLLLMQAMPPETLGRVMKIKGNLLEKTYDLYQQIDPDYDLARVMDVYQGVVFKELGAAYLPVEQQAYLEQHLVILSAMYGILQPDNLMYPYRLDMTMKPEGINLYHYWQDLILAYFSEVDWIVDLASAEFSKMLKPFEERILRVEFKYKVGDAYRTVPSIEVKQQRGKMLRKMVAYQVKTMDDMYQMDWGEYLRDEQNTTRNRLVLIKR